MQHPPPYFKHATWLHQIYCTPLFLKPGSAPGVGGAGGRCVGDCGASVCVAVLMVVVVGMFIAFLGSFGRFLDCVTSGGGCVDCRGSVCRCGVSGCGGTR